MFGLQRQDRLSITGIIHASPQRKYLAKLPIEILVKKKSIMKYSLLIIWLLELPLSPEFPHLCWPPTLTSTSANNCLQQPGLTESRCCKMTTTTTSSETSKTTTTTLVMTQLLWKTLQIPRNGTGLDDNPLTWRTGNLKFSNKVSYLKGLQTVSFLHKFYLKFCQGFASHLPKIQVVGYIKKLLRYEQVKTLLIFESSVNIYQV